MERIEIGRFEAETFNHAIIQFIVYNDNTMDCPYLNIKGISRMRIKPRFILSYPGRIYEYDQNDLVKSYHIDSTLLSLLKEKNIIRYSTDMAYYYGFEDKDGFDKNTGVAGSPYKHASKKGPILVKQKMGQFH